MPRKRKSSSIDETYIKDCLKLSPAERLDYMERMLMESKKMRNAKIVKVAEPGKKYGRRNP